MVSTVLRVGIVDRKSLSTFVSPPLNNKNNKGQHGTDPCMAHRILKKISLCHETVMTVMTVMTES